MARAARRPAAADHRAGRPRVAEVSPCEGLAIAQDMYESVLRTEAAERAEATLRWGSELQSFAVSDGGVDAVVDGQPVRARYLVAADGVRSGIRAALGVQLDGEDDLGTSRSIAFRADLTPWTGPVPRGLYVLTGAGGVLLATHPDGRWVVNSGDPDPDAAAAVRRITGVPDLEVEVLAQGRWTAVARSARRYADGPVFLVGERPTRCRPRARRGSARRRPTCTTWPGSWPPSWTGGRGRACSPLRGRAGAVGRSAVVEARNAWVEFQNPGATPFAGRTLRQIDMGYGYASAAVVDGRPDLDEEGDYTPTAHPGRRAPHLRLADGRSVLDLFGRDLTLLTAPDGQAWRAAVPGGVTAHTVDQPEWPARYGVSARGAVLVRPDGHVACVRPTCRRGRPPVRRPLPASPALLRSVVDRVMARRAVVPVSGAQPASSTPPGTGAAGS